MINCFSMKIEDINKNSYNSRMAWMERDEFHTLLVQTSKRAVSLRMYGGSLKIFMIFDPMALF